MNNRHVPLARPAEYNSLIRPQVWSIAFYVSASSMLVKWENEEWISQYMIASCLYRNYGKLFPNDVLQNHENQALFWSED